MKPFKRTYIEITNACNLRCGFCPGTSRHVRFMSPARFDTILDRLDNWSEHICFHVLGEPLLHPDIGVLIDSAHAHGKVVNLTTNGTLIGEAGDGLIGRAGLRQITVSMNSFSSGHDLSSINEYLGPILAFARKAGKHHFVSLRVWDEDCRNNTGTTATMIRIIEDTFSPSPSLKEKAALTGAVRCDENIYLNPVRRFDWPDSEGPDQDANGFCLGLRSQIAILVDGTVVPCCLDRNGEIALGNILEQPIAGILESERAGRIIRGFSERRVVEPLCRKCTYRLRFAREALP